MCEYLYAAFSLKTEPDETLPAEHMETVERWRSMVLGVAAQEMLHWALVNNLLTAVGSAPYVARPHMPHQAKGYPAGVQLALVPFGERALRHFLFLERPEGMELARRRGVRSLGPGAADHGRDGHRPVGPGVPHRRPPLPLDRGRHRATSPSGSARTGCSSARMRPRPPRSRSVGRSSSRSPTSRPPAGRSTTSSSRARGREATGAPPTTAASSPSSTSSSRSRQPTPRSSRRTRSSRAGVRPVDGVHPDVVITDPVTAAVSDLFNVNYDLILQILVRFFANVGEDREQLGLLARRRRDAHVRGDQAAGPAARHAPGGSRAPRGHGGGQLPALLPEELPAAAPPGDVDPLHRAARRGGRVRGAHRRRPAQPRPCSTTSARRSTPG